MEFIEKLRSETRHLHSQLEQNALALALMSDKVSMENYVAYISRMYGFLVPFEENVYPRLESVPGIETERKATTLAADLLAAGVDPHSLLLMPVDQFNIYDTTAAAMGGFYVLEGSALGNAVIHKHLTDHLGERLEGKLSYFAAGGATTGSNWRQFLQSFSIYAETSGEAEGIIGGAAATFKLLDKWMRALPGQQL